MKKLITILFISSIFSYNIVPNIPKDKMAKIDKEILISNDTDNITPNNAEWANVSPKNDKRLQTTKHPRGPVTKAIPIPAIKAL